MGFDIERFQLQQLASARSDSMPFDVWMHRCCRRLARHVPGIAPEAIEVLAHGLWLSHWFDSPEATADEAASASPVERFLGSAPDDLAA